VQLKVLQRYHTASEKAQLSTQQNEGPLGGICWHPRNRTARL